MSAARGVPAAERDLGGDVSYGEWSLSHPRISDSSKEDGQMYMRFSSEEAMSRRDPDAPPGARRQLVLALVFARPLMPPDRRSSPSDLRVHMLLGDYPLLQLVGEADELGRPLFGPAR